MKLRIITIVLVLAIVCTLPLAAQKAGVIGTVHDISGCQTCHAPHNGSLANSGTQATGKILLWARVFTSVTFGTYTSPTLNNVALEIGTTTPAATEPRLYSFLCMSCHDGVTTGTTILPTAAAAVGNVANSEGLQNDHPVNMSHDPSPTTGDPGLDTVANVTAAGLKLYGTGNTVQCASCHDAHNDTIGPFLRISNTNSGLCLTCHL